MSPTSYQTAPPRVASNTVPAAAAGQPRGPCPVSGPGRLRGGSGRVRIKSGSGGPMSLYDTPINTLDGTPGRLSKEEGKVTLMVNVASKCGLTPQYEGLERLQERYADRGFSVLGFPCNQFLGQEPGSAEEIATFCSTNYGVTFQLFEKIDVNGDERHPLYEVLTKAPDGEGYTGDIRWNFEKFLVSSDGKVVARFGPQVEPEAAEVTGVIENSLSG